MRCRRVQKWLVVAADRELPDWVQRHLEACADCRRFREQTEKVAGIIGLARYERPDAARAALLRQRILGRLRGAGSTESESLVAWPSFTLARAALLGVVAAMIGASLLLPRVEPLRELVPPARPVMRPVVVASGPEPLPETNRPEYSPRPGIVPVTFHSFSP